MERSVGLSGRPEPSWQREVGIASSLAPEAAPSQRRLPGVALLLLGEIVAFAALQVSGNIPEIVTVLFRALLTL